MDIDRYVERLKEYNASYRSGNPEITDAEYDSLVETLRRQAPDHPFLNMVETEDLNGKPKIRHPYPMLSTEKTYTRDGIERFVARVSKEAGQIGVDNLVFRVTPKLDGVSGRSENGEFATRGDGRFGQDISNAWKKGVVAQGGRDMGLGEIVVERLFFEKHLADKCTHPRNIVAGLLSADVLSDAAQSALSAGAVRFVPYKTLSAWEGPASDLTEQFTEIIQNLGELYLPIYHTDGFVIEVKNEDVKNYMGATDHHYRWQIAFKQKGQHATTQVIGVVWQTGRTGNVTPVLEINPVELSGATIRRVTAHHAGMVRNNKLGQGAQIQIIRSGEVIPKIESVILPAATVLLPDRCPSCDTALEWENDFLRCPGVACTAQLGQRIEHWFKTMGNADWFGPKAIEKIIGGGVDSLEKIYALSEEDFQTLGFGPGQSKNLADALIQSRTRRVEDWRFLAAFGIPCLGKGDSRNLLTHVRLEDCIDVSCGQIRRIHGFGEITSERIVAGIAAIRPTMRHIISLGFNLEHTPIQSETSENSGPLNGKTLVFTGKMSGSRSAMEDHARSQGAAVSGAVSGKTDYLVCGEKVGASKIQKARKMNVEVISEKEYRELCSMKTKHNA